MSFLARTTEARQRARRATVAGGIAMVGVVMLAPPA
jgi:hypothetical protein